MAASVESSVSTTSLTSGTTFSSSSYTIAGANRVLYVLVGSGAGTPVAPSSVKWGGSGGTSMTQIGTTIDISIYGKISVWRLIAPTATTSTIYVTWGSSQDEKWLIGVNVQDADQTTPNNTVAQATGTSTTPSVNATSTSGQLVLDFMSWMDLGNNSRTVTVGASQTSIKEVEGATLGYEGAGSSYETATGASTTMSWTISGAVDNTGIYAFSINDASGSPTTSRPLLITQASRIARLISF